MQALRNLIFTALILLTSYNLRAQFSTDKLELRIGYNVQNTSAKQVNHLIDVFNNTRYPHETANNLASINFPLGFLFGANYEFNEDIILYTVLKSRKQFIQAEYIQIPKFRKYLFRSHTLEAGITVPLRDDDFFNHYVGGGVLLGVMEAYTSFETRPDYHGSRKMTNIDNSGIIGISLAYEAQFRLHRNVRIFIRPVAQFALGSPIRKLSNFFDPQISATGEVTYGEGEAEKYDKANFNGIGIEGGLLVLLPEF